MVKKVHLLKYTKPYAAMVILAIVLLFVQANADLALPDYLSKIVNTGIQQGGVENAVPVAIREVQMNRSVIFMNDQEKTDVMGDYTLIHPTSSDASTYIDTYPVLVNESVFIRKDITQAEIDRINLVMAKALLVVTTIEQIMTDPTKAAEMGINLGFDPTQLPPGFDVFLMLKNLPEANRTQLNNAINQRFISLGDNMVIQAGVQAVISEYKAIGMDLNHIQTMYLLRVGGLMLLLTLLSMTSTIIVGYFAAKVSTGLSRDMRRDIFQKVEGFSSIEFDKFSTASLITRSTNDVTQMQMLTFMIIRMVFYAPIMGVGGIIRALDTAPSMWWILAVAVLTIIGIIVMVFSLAFPKFKIIQKLMDRLNLVARESLTGMLVIRAFNKQPAEEKRFDKANLDITAVSLYINRVMVVMMPLMMLIMNGISIAIIWVGAHEVADAAIQVGDMMAFMQYGMQVLMSFLMLTMMFIMIPRALVSGDRISEVLQVDPSIKDPENPQQFTKPITGVVEFRDVSFKYPNAEMEVLQHITFTAKPGQTTAIIGPTGCGKSTVVNLIPRFYDVTTGSVLIDGIDIRQVSQHELRENIGYVPQKSALFTGTIASNLLYADEKATEEQLRSSIEIAQATEFVSSKPQGMATEIAQGGANVSGGQKQRLSIARALVKRPQIYIFDDSVSALDFKTDAALRRALKANTGSSTIFIVTQRVSTVKTAEQIIVLDEGKIVGKGTHAELMAGCPTYKEIALSQLKLEELI